MMAENLISDELLDSYLTYTDDCLEKLEKLQNTLVSEEAEVPQLRNDFYAIFHDIKGMGGSFNYPLMTSAGTSICRYLRLLGEKSPLDSEIIEAHVKAMRAILNNNITGTGDDTGTQLINRLNELVDHSLA